MQQEIKQKENINIKCLIVVYSYHHNNTLKIANKFAEVLHAEVKAPEEVNPQELQDYELIGFGAGIDSGRHYKQLLDFVEIIPLIKDKYAFIFSTSAIQGKDKVTKDHLCLRQKLENKGYIIVDEFSCKGFNTNSFLKYLGGMNKGKPDETDLKHAEEFALRLLINMKK